jgi:tetratricopeptide (TPR) repeat protein
MIYKYIFKKMVEPDVKGGWMLDSYPRTVPQAEALEKILPALGQLLHQEGTVKAVLGEGADLGNLGLAYYKLGQREKAVEYMRAALTIFEQIESPYAEQARKTLARWQEDEKPE